MTRSESPGPDPADRLSCLAEPVRRRLYEYVAAQGGPVTREDAATAAGIGRTLAAYHLDKLVDAGLLSTSYARPEGKGGPGAGRPAKRYAATGEELALSVPPRNYPLLADVLATAVTEETSGALQAAVLRAARNAGRAVQTAHTDLLRALRACGYDPARCEEGSIELRNCPFHQLARTHPDLVCGLNHAYVQGLIEAFGRHPTDAHLRAGAGRCCVVIDPAGG